MNEQKPVAWLEPEWGEKICPEVGYEVTMTDDHPRDLCWIPLYAHPPQNTNETDEEIKSKCPRTDSIWSLGWYEGYKACNKNTAQAYLKGFDAGCKSMSAKNKTENIGCLGMPVNVPEPVAWFSTLPDGKLSIKIVGKPTDGNWEPLYTTPPRLVRDIEAKLKEKNNG